MTPPRGQGRGLRLANLFIVLAGITGLAQGRDIFNHQKSALGEGGDVVNGETNTVTPALRASLVALINHAPPFLVWKFTPIRKARGSYVPINLTLCGRAIITCMHAKSYSLAIRLCPYIWTEVAATPGSLARIAKIAQLSMHADSRRKTWRRMIFHIGFFLGRPPFFPFFLTAAAFLSDRTFPPLVPMSERYLRTDAFMPRTLAIRLWFSSLTASKAG